MFNKVCIVFLALTWACCAALPCDKFESDEVFTCSKNNSQLVNIFGIDFKCANGTICNANYAAYEGICSPCIDVKYVCDDKVFRCIDSKSFKMGKNVFTCPKDTECNKEKLTTCAPCILGKCNPDLWECDPNNEKNVTIGGMEITCPGNEVCNKEKMPPCTACIQKRENFFSKYLADLPEWDQKLLD